MSDPTGVILQYVKKEYLDEDDDKLTPDTKLISSGIVDSFSMVSLKLFIEKTYDIQIPDREATPACSRKSGTSAASRRPRSRSSIRRGPGRGTR